MDVRMELFAQHGGLVRTCELIAIGENDELIRMARNYGVIVPVRHGWWALPDTPAIHLRAWRARGRLACVSALAYHGVVLDLGDPLHVEVPAHGRGAQGRDLVVHWSASRANGDRRAVSVEVAARQASRCRAAAGNL